MKFTAIKQELEEKLLVCEVVKRNLRKHCSFSVEMQYRLIINFIGMGCYGNIEAVLQNLIYHPETSQLDSEEIMRSVKELLQCAVKLDTLHKQDMFHQMKSTALINEEENIFAAKIGRWLET
ncbi:hypothetical protein VPHK567_0390 [Vibrio phage K567]|nr:hypothetical protein MYOV011v1_p0239 [Vibrio phage 6E35.1a]